MRTPLPFGPCWPVSGVLRGLDVLLLDDRSRRVVHRVAEGAVLLVSLLIVVCHVRASALVVCHKDSHLHVGPGFITFWVGAPRMQKSSLLGG